eukprot:CAMPEP_0117419274 /NCGR_PEP_ID=MMETSP0758-20121206/870_1 /TAXON_ID=63605 /ORGANISM="Percolomonas cosmopolitus, Strain AE-1 (ATCC 50343)" /LENGTH=532 /DNA_ID=CAMNT_0005200243 /DNA_START=15 /DNA_END=1610 /DNA_ORIENTATION=+
MFFSRSSTLEEDKLPNNIEEVKKEEEEGKIIKEEEKKVTEQIEEEKIKEEEEEKNKEEEELLNELTLTKISALSEKEEEEEEEEEETENEIMKMSDRLMETFREKEKTFETPEELKTTEEYQREYLILLEMEMDEEFSSETLKELLKKHKGEVRKVEEEKNKEEEEEEEGETIELVSLENKPDMGEATSLTAKAMTEECWEECKDKKTSGGFGFDLVINSGCKNLDSGVGCYAPDEEAYKTFETFFNHVIEAYHNYGPEETHKTDLNIENFKGTNVDEEGKYVVSTRIRVGRNLEGYPLAPGISKAQRKEVEKKIVEALKTLEGDLAGEYYAIQGMEKEVQERLIADHFLFKEGDRFLKEAGANRDWPEGRGIYHSEDKHFLVWVNEEDELRIISMQMGGNVKEVFERLTRAIATMEEKLTFASNEHLGYISSCPTNLGTAMRASVHVKIPNVSKQENFKEWCAERHLSVRGIHGEHSESEGGIYDISNKRRLGLSEVECVQTMYDGVEALIEWEKKLEAENEEEKEEEKAE